MRRVEVEALSRHYGRFWALRRVDLTLEAGDGVALLGANGAGKTTLLHVLATLEPPDRGRVHYDGAPWREFARRGRQLVGWVGHEPLVYADLTGRENLAFFATMYGLEAARAPEAWLERVGLADFADERVAHYSRGMVQRLTLARALLPGPRLLLLDEPLTGLDRPGRALVAGLLAAQRDAGAIVVVSTHDLASSAALCRRAIVLRRGAVAFDGEVGDAGALAAAYDAHA